VVQQQPRQAAVRGSPRLGGLVENQPVLLDGQRFCRTCHEHGRRTPNHPEHPHSPYCLEHYREHRSAAQRLWRDKQKAVKEAERRAADAASGVSVTTDGKAVLTTPAVRRLQESLRQTSAAITDLLETLDLAPGNAQGLKMVGQAARDLSDLRNDLTAWVGSLTPEANAESADP